MMVRQMKEDAKGKSEEELAEYFRIPRAGASGPWEQPAWSSLNLALRATRHPGAVGGCAGGAWARGEAGPAGPEPRAQALHACAAERRRLHRRGAGEIFRASGST